jgi:hypothetical protein
VRAKQGSYPQAAGGASRIVQLQAYELLRLRRLLLQERKMKTSSIPSVREVSPQSQPHATTEDQAKEMESEGQAQPQGVEPPPAPDHSSTNRRGNQSKARSER